MSSYPVNALLMPLSLDQSWSWDTSGQQTESSDSTQARYILNRLFQDYPTAFAVRLWNGSMLTIGEGAPAFTFCLEQASVLRDMVWFSDPRRLAEAYCAGEVQIQGDFHAAMQLREHFESLSLPLHEKLGLLFRALTLANNPHEQPEQRTANSPQVSTSTPTLPSIALSYDAPDDFYQCWLDEHMLHSCAYFAGSTEDLTQAQQKQLDLICLKLHLQHGDSLLDIACGWGGLACWAAKHYGVFVHGITQNPAQYAYAVKQVQRQGLGHLVTIELRDYRDLPELGQYDKAACIGIAEHAGAHQLPHDLKKVHGLLKAGGLFLSHGITTENPAWQQQASNEVINRHLYPQGTLATFPELLQHMDAAKFDVFNVEGLRRHYVMTLQRWLARLEAQHAAVSAMVGERTYRLWRLYMTASVIQFEQGVTGMHQILATRR
ncbi:class I SAM-dependent methyltransferase [Methylophilus sp. 'Pure River']|uniref:class I SAM-dependent methyltransferase n=1 Tax=Methylophilus sp. 'Pure River' TaxID=3377117 RepID=UPI00398F88AF